MAIPRRPLAAGLHAAAYMVAFAAVVSLAAASWSAPADPVLVKGDPSVLEGVSTAHGAWIGWVQSSSTSTSHDNFFVQRGGQAPVRVNAARTSGLGGGIAGHGVFYVQQFGDRRPQLIRYDLRTGDRAPLPAKVNHYRHYAHVSCCGGQPSRSHVLSGVRGHATVSGPWVLYSGSMEDLPRGDTFLVYTVMLYNRVTHQLRTLASYSYDRGLLDAGQVNGDYATYWSYEYDSELYRYDVRAKRSVKLAQPASGDQYDPAVSKDGTVYYFVTDADAPSGGPYDTELVRQPVGGPAEVVVTLTTESRSTPRETFVKDRSDGRRVVFFSWKGDVYKYVDDPQ